LCCLHDDDGDVKGPLHLDIDHAHHADLLVLEASTVSVESKADESAICRVIRSAGYDNEKLAA
jgi:hypothetical protein